MLLKFYVLLCLFHSSFADLTIFKWGSLSIVRANSTWKNDSSNSTERSEPFNEFLDSFWFKFSLPKDVWIREQRDLSSDVATDSRGKKKYMMLYPMIALAKLASMKVLLLSLIVKVLGIKKLLILGLLALPLLFKSKCHHQSDVHSPSYFEYPPHYYNFPQTPPTGQESAPYSFFKPPSH